MSLLHHHRQPYVIQVLAAVSSFKGSSLCPIMCQPHHLLPGYLVCVVEPSSTYCAYILLIANYYSTKISARNGTISIRTRSRCPRIERQSRDNKHISQIIIGTYTYIDGHHRSAVAHQSPIWFEAVSQFCLLGKTYVVSNMASVRDFCMRPPTTLTAAGANVTCLQSSDTALMDRKGAVISL